MHRESPDKLLRDGLRILDIPFTEEQIAQFQSYLNELKKWNRAYNLTSIDSDADIVIKHFLDSLLFLKVLPADVRSIADIGSGAGFPGLPIRIMRSDIKMVLVEPVQKKALFLEHMQRTLKIQNLEIRNMRIEQINDIMVDAAVTRALFSVKDFISKAERILTAQGVLILSKGPKVEEEMQGIGKNEVHRQDMQLPFTDSIRHMLVICRKT